MAYIAAAAFREGSKQWYTAQATLTEEQASTTDITAAIASFSAQFDSWTNDHFEATTSTEFTLDVREVGRRLYLPRRVRSVTQVETVDEDGVATVETATTYRVHSSLNAAGTEAVGDLYTAALIELGLILFLITTIVLACSKLLLLQLARREGAKT